MFKSRKKRRGDNEVNTSSTADIAFLLLVFFLVTTQIQSDKGITMMLPPDQDNTIDIKQRNVLNILVNSNDNLMIDNELKTTGDIKVMAKKHITNNGVLDNFSEKPTKAIISIKTDRGTSYDAYILVLDQVKETYAELRAAHLGISLSDYRSLDKKNPKDSEMLQQAKEAYPMMISDANPTDVGK